MGIETCRLTGNPCFSNSYTSVVSCKCLYRILGETGGGTSAIDLEEDVAAGGLPNVRLGGEVALGEIAFDGAHKLGETGKAALAHSVLGEVAEETLNQVHPRAGGRGEVKDNALAAIGLALAAVAVGDPSLHLGMLVGGVIVG